MSIPAFDLTRQYQSIGNELEAVVRDVMAKGHFILGEHVAALEADIAEYCGVRFGIGVANGSDALHLALEALGVGPGDEVVVPAFTFFATAGAVARTGAIPVFADIDPVSFNLLPDSFSEKITPQTKAVIPVHLYGNPANMDGIMAVARAHGIRVIEDCAQAIGAEYNGRRVGSFGDLATLSFFPTKNLGAFGDGGMVVSSDPDLAERVRMLRVHGAKRKYHHEVMGYNSRLDELQAAILRVKLRYLDRWTGARREIASEYSRRLSGSDLGLPCLPDGHKHVFHQYTVTCQRRDDLQAYLSQHGIGSTVYYPVPLHRQPVFGTFAGTESLPCSEQACASVLSLPMFPELTTQEVDDVVSSIHQFSRSL